MTFRQKQRVAGMIGGLGMALLVVAIGGFVARTLRAPEPVVAGSGGGEEMSAAGSRPSVAPENRPDPAPPAQAPERAHAPASDTAAEPPAPQMPAAVPGVQETPARAGLDHYPLSVGSWWVYEYHEGDVVTRVERRINRRENGEDGRELYFFDDGTIAYVEGDRIYELGSNGGVNIVPVAMAKDADPVRYRSQGLQIEKWLAHGDTAVVVAGHRYERCVEVVTRFRPVGEPGGRSVSYSSFYAPGIGLVGRQQWPVDQDGRLAVTLTEYGTIER